METVTERKIKTVRVLIAWPLAPSTCGWPTEKNRICNMPLKLGVFIAQGTLYRCEKCEKKDEEHLTLYPHGTVEEFRYHSLLKVSIGKELEKEFRDIEIADDS